MSDEGGTASNSGLLACEQCEKRFTRPENLARHMKTHDQIRKHSCQTCGRKFTRSDLRKKHELLHERAMSARAVSKARRASKNISIQRDPLSSHIAPDSTPLSYVDEQGTNQSMDVEVAGVIQQAQTQTTSIDESLVHGSWGAQLDFTPYFDYTNFARPWNYTLDQTAETTDWFSSQFFAALRETDLAYSPPFQTWEIDNHDLVDAHVISIQDHHHLRHSSHYLLSEIPDVQSNRKEASQNTEVESLLEADMEIRSGQMSRIASPPNESSHEDRLPFAWDPRSKPLAKAKPIVLAADDPIFAGIDPTVEITQATLTRIQNFLRPKDHSTGEDIFALPSLALVNVFVSLFFSRFLPQAPVLHRPTLDIEALPPALLAIIMVIGSCYSRLRNARRFGIVVLDRVRQNLLAIIEEDNGLMREPLVIYATALVCYMGLWCGNKRAFELSEALHAVAVTYIRRLPDTNDQREDTVDPNDIKGQPTSAIPSRPKPSVESQWRGWVAQESRKRLRWFVYMLDMQFPSILGMSSMLTTADVRRWECPCDESFWVLTAAGSWRSQLGSASQPACSVFGYLVALIFSTTTTVADEALLPGVNAWSANLLLTAIMGEVFHFQDTLVVLRTYDKDLRMPTNPTNGAGRAAHLLSMLEVWSNSYQHQQPPRGDPTSAHLRRCSTIMYYMTRLYLVFPISDIQDCLGKSGPTGTSAAMSRLSSWIVQHPEDASRVVEDASVCISIVMSNKGESDPYDIIGLFLCHVIVWSFVNAAPPCQKERTITLMRDNPNILQSVLAVVEAGLESGNNTSADDFHASQLIFRHAVHALVQLGDWGASANLALLLHLHPGPQNS
ncbi:C2H2 type zinc finger domain protein [Stagonosporopsis vannaccii]|nr:C2H2 type zinc finger domain protein [Stagonosporopsis vannaccii]